MIFICLAAWFYLFINCLLLIFFCESHHEFVKKFINNLFDSNLSSKPIPMPTGVCWNYFLGILCLFRYYVFISCDLILRNLGLSDFHGKITFFYAPCFSNKRIEYVTIINTGILMCVEIILNLIIAYEYDSPKIIQFYTLLNFARIIFPFLCITLELCASLLVLFFLVSNDPIILNTLSLASNILPSTETNTN